MLFELQRLWDALSLSSSGQLRTCITLKCFMRKLFVNNSCLWSRHGRKIFSFTSHVAGARGPPWGGERESLTSMCFSFVKHHTSTVWLTHALLYMIYAVSSCDRWVICKVGKAPENLWALRALSPSLSWTAVEDEPREEFHDPSHSL